MREALDRLGAQLHKEPNLFDRVFYKCDLRPLHDRALLFLPIEKIRQIEDILQGMDMLLAPPAGLKFVDPLLGWKNLNLSQLVSEAERRVFATPEGQPARPQDHQFFAQLAAIARTAADSLDDPARYASPWHRVLPDADGPQDLLAEPQYFFSEDGKLAFLLARPTKDVSSFTAADQSINRIRDIIDA